MKVDPPPAVQMMGIPSSPPDTPAFLPQPFTREPWGCMSASFHRLPTPWGPHAQPGMVADLNRIHHVSRSSSRCFLGRKPSPCSNPLRSLLSQLHEAHTTTAQRTALHSVLAAPVFSRELQAVNSVQWARPEGQENGSKQSRKC